MSDQFRIGKTGTFQVDREESGTFEIEAPLATGHLLKEGSKRPFVVLERAGKRVRCRLGRLGFESITVVPHELGLEFFERGFCSAVIEGKGAIQLECRALRTELDADGTVTAMTFRLTQLTRAVARKLMLLAATLELHAPTVASSSSAQTEDIVQPSRVSTIVRALVSNESDALIRADGHDWVLKAESFDGDRIHWRVLEQGAAPASPLVIEATGYSGVYRLPVLVVSEDVGRMTTTRPKRIFRSRQRRMPRGGTARAYQATFAHPLWPSHTVRADVIDVAHGGIGLAIDPLEDLLHPGLALPSIEITREGVLVAHLDAIVRTASPLPSETTCGVSVRPVADVDARAWKRIVSEELHETSHDFPDDPEEIWSLFCESGYLNLSGKKPEEFRELHDSFITSSRKLRRAPEMSCQVVWPSSLGTAASVTQLKTYSGSWLDFHLAKLPGKVVDGVPGRRVLRDIHLHSIEHLLADPEMRWFLGYIQDDGSRFSKLAMLDFLDRVDDGKMACGVPFTALEVQVSSGAEPPTDVRVATTAETERLVGVIAASRPEAYCKAHDYTLETFDLRHIRATWQRAGLLRERTVLVAEENGEAVAAAILEAAEDGLHLFGLLDTVRLFPLRAGGAQHFEALLGGARNWYATLGKSKFIVMDEWRLPDGVLGARNLGSAICAVLSDALIPDYLDHFFEWMAWAPVGQSQFPPALAPQPNVAPLRESA